MITIEHRQGATFTLAATARDEAGTAINLSNYVITSDVRRAAKMGGQLIARLSVTVTSAEAGQYNLQAPGDGTSAGWPVGEAQMDVVYEAPAQGGKRNIHSTAIQSIMIVAGITK